MFTLRTITKLIFMKVKNKALSTDLGLGEIYNSGLVLTQSRLMSLILSTPTLRATLPETKPQRLKRYVPSFDLDNQRIQSGYKILKRVIKYTTLHAIKGKW